MSLISIKPTQRTGSLSLKFEDVVRLDSLKMVTKLSLTKYNSVMVYCGRDMEGFYNGCINDLLKGLGWNRC